MNKEKGFLINPFELQINNGKEIYICMEENAGISIINENRIDFIAERKLEVIGKLITMFSFEKPTLDGEIFEYLFFLAVKRKLLIGGFNCSVDLRKKWKPVARQIILSMEERKAE